MSLSSVLLRTPNRRIGMIALLVVMVDQMTKLMVREFLGDTQEKVVVDGFFKFVHWAG